MSFKRLSRVVLLLALVASLVGCTQATPTAVVEPTVAAATPTPVPPTATPEPPTATPEPATATPEQPTAAPTAEGPSSKTAAANELVLATTTSTENSGLLKYLLPDFEKETGIKVSVIAVGTGQSLKLGENGDADVVLVHARALEDEFMAAGHGVRREDVMYNDFIIVGPEADPAGIAGMNSAVDAFKAIGDTKSTFVSRGDESGTHVKEKEVWAAAGIEPKGDWYISAGQGMGAVLTMADELQGYTLSDRATYLARTLEGTDLVILVEGDPLLFNPYGLIAVNPNKGPHIKADLANQFIDWFISVPTQEKIAAFGMEEFGQSLFVPDSQPWRDAHQGTGTVALKASGKVAMTTGWTLAQLKAMDMVKAEVENKSGTIDVFEGVPLVDLLAALEPAADATTVVLVASDGFTAEVPLADVEACPTCVVAPQEDGTLRAAMPGMSSKFQVKDLTELRIE
ncbi:MAG: substrate-binding domain-containing protein [Anaerolineales bacterium]